VTWLSEERKNWAENDSGFKLIQWQIVVIKLKSCTKIDKYDLRWPDTLLAEQMKRKVTWSRWSRCDSVTDVNWEMSDRLVSPWLTTTSMSSSWSFSLSNIWRRRSRSPTSFVTPVSTHQSQKPVNISHSTQLRNTVCNSVAISADFSEENENWTVSEIAHDCQSVIQYFVTWPWSSLLMWR